MSKIEIVREIVTVASILIKTSCEDILEKRETFIAFLNELGLRNEHGRELNVANFKKMIDVLTDDERSSLLEEFNEGFEDIYRHLAMHNA